jgi:hypothetical protein
MDPLLLLRFAHLIGLMLMSAGLIGVFVADMRSRQVRDVKLFAQAVDPEAQAITECLYSFLSAHQLKQFGTKRRRIRAHFGSPDNIVAAALTIGQAMTKNLGD